MDFQVIAITGKMFAGKTTFAKMLSASILTEEDKEKPDLVIFQSFAIPIKDSIKKLLLKKDLKNFKDQRGRVVMQGIGDIIRSVYGTDYFVRLLNERVDEIIKLKQPNSAIIIIDDLRFKSEVEALSKIYGGDNLYVVKILADRENREKRAKNLGRELASETHISEVDLDGYDFMSVANDYIEVDNNYCMAELADAAISVVDELKIVKKEKNMV